MNTEDLKDIPKKLRDHVLSSVIPRYEVIGHGHGRAHIERVISESLNLALRTGARTDMAFVIAAYHDLGMEVSRATHHLESARMLLEDEVLRSHFSAGELGVMAQAIRDHRASSGHEPESLYGRIVAEADRYIETGEVIRRCLEYGLEHHPGLDSREQVDRAVSHLCEKYGDGGYLRLYFQESGNALRLEQLRTLLRDKEKTVRTVSMALEELLGKRVKTG